MAAHYATAGLDTWFQKKRTSAKVPLPKVPQIVLCPRLRVRCCVSVVACPLLRVRCGKAGLRRQIAKITHKPQQRQHGRRTQVALRWAGSLTALPDFVQLALQFCSSHIVSNHFSTGPNQHHGW
jgi:hypothetical protein